MNRVTLVVVVLFSFCFGLILYCVEISLMTRVPPLVLFCEKSTPHVVFLIMLTREREHGHATATSMIYAPKPTEHAQGRRVLLEAYNNMVPVVLWTLRR